MNSDHAGRTEPAPVGPVTIAELCTHMQRLLPAPDHLTPSRIETGTLAHALLMALPDPGEPARLSALSPSALIGALPIVLRAELAPEEWRLVDADGEVLREGRLG